MGKLNAIKTGIKKIIKRLSLSKMAKSRTSSSSILSTTRDLSISESFVNLSALNSLPEEKIYQTASKRINFINSFFSQLNAPFHLRKNPENSEDPVFLSADYTVNIASSVLNDLNKFLDSPPSGIVELQLFKDLLDLLIPSVINLLNRPLSAPSFVVEKRVDYISTVLDEGLAVGSEPDWHLFSLVYSLLETFADSKTVSNSNVGSVLTKKESAILVNLLGSFDPRERLTACGLLKKFYTRFPSVRTDFREDLSAFIKDFLFGTKQAHGVSEALEIWGVILGTLSSPLRSEFQESLRDIFIPLHASPSLIYFYSPLFDCMEKFVALDEPTASLAIRSFLSVWPVSNASKEIIFLREVDALLHAWKFAKSKLPLNDLFSCVARAVCSSNVHVAENALGLLVNSSLVKSILSESSYNSLQNLAKIEGTAENEIFFSVSEFAKHTKDEGGEFERATKKSRKSIELKNAKTTIKQVKDNDKKELERIISILNLGKKHWNENIVTLSEDLFTLYTNIVDHEIVEDDSRRNITIESNILDKYKGII